MKKIFLIILTGLAGWTQLSAQCQCDFQVEFVQDPVDSCYFDVLFCNNGGPACNFPAIYGPLTIFTNGNPSATASIAAVTSADPINIGATLQGSYQAVFSASNFTGMGCNPKVQLGRICLDNAPNSLVDFSATIFQPGAQPCDIPILFSQFEAPSTCASQPGFFEKLCGGNEEDRPTAVKAFGDGVYVSGYKSVNNVDFGFFKKYDLTTGMLIWERELTTQSRLVDFEYVPATDEFLVVGWTTPFSSSADNRSILVKIDDLGNLVHSKSYAQNGREGFTRIVRHAPDPNNPNLFPYYILGRKNPTATPSGNDVVVLYNVDASCTLNWAMEYAHSSNPTDDEFFLGLFPYGANLIMTGLVTNNDGALVEIDATNGNVIRSVRYPHALDIYDGIELYDGRIAIVGEDFSVNQAFVMVINPFTPNPFSTAFGNSSTLVFPNIFNFKDIWEDQYGKLYVIGENKNTMLGKNYQVVHKINYFAHGGPSNLSVDWSKYLEDLFLTETSYANGVISVTPTHDRIFYADARLKSQPLFGSWDMLVGSYDLSLSSSCEYAFQHPTNQLPLATIQISVTNSAISEPLFLQPQVQPFESCCAIFCAQEDCIADFTWVPKECFEMTFTASTNTCFAGAYTYDWDFGDGQTATSNSPVINHTFPCGGGTFTVCVTVTDPVFNCPATICKTVNVNNSNGCSKVDSVGIACNPNDFDAFDFIIKIKHNGPAASCSYTLTSALPGVVLTPPIVSNGFPITTITGTATVVAWPTPTALIFNVSMNCVCPNPPGGSFTDNFPVSIPTICCKAVDIPLPIVCEDDATFDVQIQPFGTLCNITQVTWYMQPKPANGICPSTYWGGKPYQDNLTNVLEPLHLYPAQMSGDVCVYAVVQMNDGPCTKDTTNIACVQLCAPTTCTLQSDQEWCYMGTPIVASPLTLVLNSPPNACFPTIQWCAPDGSVVQQGGLVYNPTQLLSMSNPLVDCYEDFFYTVKITDLCGTRECKVRIRLYSDDAPKGTLQVLPYEANTLCPYEDITLNFIPGCDSDDPKTWTWHTRPCDPSGTCTPVQGSGMMSDNWFTNMLQTSAYYYVETQNGPCPVDSVQLFLEVKEPLSLILFDAIPDPCVEQQVDLSISWNPCTVAGCLPGTPCSTQCSHTVEWYKGCIQIGITNEPAGVTSSTFTYTTLPLDGNYYAVVKDDCCPNNMVTSQLVTILPSCEPVIAGPCFVCENEQVTLMDMSVIPPSTPCPYFCGWTWATPDGNIVGPANGSSIIADAAGTYTLTTSCVLNGQVCVKSTSYTLIKCQRAVAGVQECGEVVAVEELLPSEISPVRVFPNPTSTGVTIEWGKESPKKATLFISDATGRILLQQDIPGNTTQLSADLTEFLVGVYFIKIQAEDRLYEVAKVVKQ